MTRMRLTSGMIKRSGTQPGPEASLSRPGVVKPVERQLTGFGITSGRPQQFHASAASRPLR